MPIFRFLRPLILILALGPLAACEDSAERAESYYQAALQLVDEGDVDRALIELRNVFDYDGFHKEARRLYADLQLQQGSVQDAYSQYLRLIEQYPDTVEVRRILARLALDMGNWDEVVRHGKAAVDLEPDAPESQALAAVIAYRDAVLAQDDPAAAAAAETARTLLDTNPGLTVARRVLIDWLVQGPDPSQALPQIDIALKDDPASRGLNMAKLAVLDRQKDRAAVGEQLKTMYALFPEDEAISDYLISWYLSTGDFDGAEGFLRQQAGADDAAPQGHLAVVDLIARQKGPEAARAELERLAEANAGTDLGRLYATEASALQFQQGDREAAVARLETLVAEAEGTERRLDAKMMLARMRMAMGEPDAAQALADEILGEDERYVDALKMRASQDIRSDDFGAAVNGLRLALDQAPRDSEILLLMAEAQQKAGNIELAQQNLAEAVEISRNAPRESLIYARFLLARQQGGAAETVLSNAMQSQDANLEVAKMLGEVLLQRSRFTEAEALARQLETSESPQAVQMARAMRAAILFRQNRIDESLNLLQSENGGGSAELAAMLQQIRIQVMSNRMDEARQSVERLLEQYPDSQAVHVLNADLMAIEGDASQAIAVYREVLDQSPDAIVVIERLYRLLMQENMVEEADTLIDDALARQPDARSLRLVVAARAEREDRIDDAIAIYDSLYQEDPDDVVAANNLASLLSLYKDDPEALERAYRIALRLTGSNEPAFLDTLGWVQVQRGDTDQAVVNLQAAARGLPDNPTVAFNLGLAYAAAGRTEEARREIERGLSLAGDRDVAQRALAEEKLASFDL